MFEIVAVCEQFAISVRSAETLSRALANFVVFGYQIIQIKIYMLRPSSLFVSMKAQTEYPESTPQNK